MPYVPRRPAFQQRQGWFLPEIFRDLRHALRRLLRSRAFTIAAVTLGLGIGANTAIFTVVERVILRPLPYLDSDRLLWIDHVAPGIDLPGSIGLSQGVFDYYRARARTFQSLAIYRSRDWTLTGDGAPERLSGVVATPSLAEALLTRPVLGRWFTDDEAQQRVRVIVISEGLWRSRFGSDPSILGRTLVLDGTAHEIIGVVPTLLAPDLQLYGPERIDEQQVQTVGGFNYRGIARLRDGMRVEDVKREMDALIAAIKEAFPNDRIAQEILDGARLGGMPELLKDHEIGAVRRTLWILLGMVGFVLLIACANVANLFLVRSEARQREIAVRRALGAGRSGIVRYFIAESALLSFGGALLGLVLAYGAVQMLVRFGPEDLPRLHEVSMGAASFGWTALLAVFASLLFGAIPLLRTGAALAPTLREGGRGSTVGRARFRARNGLMAMQVALALVLLVGSGLMVRSFLRLRAVDPGFDADNLLTFVVSLNWNDIPDRESAVRFHEGLMERLSALPGVESVGAITCLPFSGSCWGDPLDVRGRPLQPGELPPLAQIRHVLPGYFEAMRMPLLSGRSLDRADFQRRASLVVVSRAFARAYFPGEDAIGKQVGLMFGADVENGPRPDSAWYTIVGVVDDTPVENLAEPNRFPLIYFPALGRAAGDTHGMSFAVRSRVDPLSLVGAARDAAAEINGNVALGSVTSMQRTVEENTSRMAFTMMLLLIAGGVALILGAVGIYGVISYVIGQRRSEIGVRLALGARPSDVSAMVLRQSGGVVIIGLGVGLAAAFGSSQLMKSLLFHVSAADPITYGAVTSFLLAIAAMASWIPARRAAALDPTTALRSE